MIYRYDKRNLIYRKDTKLIKISLLTCMGLMLTTFLVGRYARIQALDSYEKELIVLNIKEEQEKFTEEKFVQLLKDLNVRFPHIVMAQSMLETGQWESKIFRENHNLFGMKEAKSRVRTAIGTQNNHAYYSNWMESVYDYAFYQCRYLSSIRTENDYFLYLSKNYAEDPNYVNKLKSAIQTHKLKEQF